MSDRVDQHSSNEVPSTMCKKKRMGIMEFGVTLKKKWKIPTKSQLLGISEREKQMSVFIAACLPQSFPTGQNTVLEPHD